MGIEGLTDIVGYVIYGVLGIIALWGAFCIVMVWRRVAQKRFRSEDAQEEFRQVDPCEHPIQEWLKLKMGQSFGIHEVLNGALELDKDRQSKAIEMRVAGILTRLEYRKQRLQKGGKRQVLWRQLPRENAE